MKLLTFTSLSNDLFADYVCPACRKRQSLTGYNDACFFREVNREPRLRTCDCGVEFAIKWTPEGVKVFE